MLIYAKLLLLIFWTAVSCVSLLLLIFVASVRTAIVEYIPIASKSHYGSKWGRKATPNVKLWM